MPPMSSTIVEVSHLPPSVTMEDRPRAMITQKIVLTAATRPSQSAKTLEVPTNETRENRTALPPIRHPSDVRAVWTVVVLVVVGVAIGLSYAVIASCPVCVRACPALCAARGGYARLPGRPKVLLQSFK